MKEDPQFWSSPGEKLTQVKDFWQQTENGLPWLEDELVGQVPKPGTPADRMVAEINKKIFHLATQVAGAAGSVDLLAAYLPDLTRPGEELDLECQKRFQGVASSLLGLARVGSLGRVLTQGSYSAIGF